MHFWSLLDSYSLPSMTVGTNWPDLHWDLNLQVCRCGGSGAIGRGTSILSLPHLQQTYYLLLNAGRLDLSTTLTDFVATITPGLATNVPSAWQSDSAAAPTGASALTALETCYWNYGPGCKTSPPSVTGNLLWTLHLVYLHAEYSQVSDDDAKAFFAFDQPPQPNAFCIVLC